MQREFIDQRSIARTIWGDPDLVLLIFAGAAAEFALNRAVDWLFVTNRLPEDPIGRLFSTVRYAQRIVFASEAQARTTLASISSIHAAVQRQRGQRIPDWAYRDVLYLLIDYSQRAHQLLQGRLSATEQAELYSAFLQVGQGLHIPQLPATFGQWEQDRQRHLARDLAYSEYTTRLYEQYRRHLGSWRYQILLEVQAALAPARVRDLLRLEQRLPIASGFRLYALLRNLGLQKALQCALVPEKYWADLDQLKPPATA
jgi:uncharacterized protein (DUF2236 family)